MIKVRSFVNTLTLLGWGAAALVVGGCGALAGGEPMSPTAAAAGVPNAPPYIRGTVIARDNRFTGHQSARVTTNPASPGSGRVADVVLTDSTTITWRNGAIAFVSDIAPGRVVSVWSDGNELRSYPPVASAVAVVIDR